MLLFDSIIQEMNHRFSEASTDLLDCIACLDPKNIFSNFDMDKLMHLADLYPVDFISTGRTFLYQKLQSFLSDMRIDGRFFNVEDLGSLAKKMKETLKDRVFPMVYCLVELTLLLPVATTYVERVFSAMKAVKIDLRNRMRDEWLNDSLVIYIENETFDYIDNELILNRFQNMDSRRNQLSRSTKYSVV